jgi:hypothetical protein
MPSNKPAHVSELSSRLASPQSRARLYSFSATTARDLIPGMRTSSLEHFNGSHTYQEL